MRRIAPAKKECLKCGKVSGDWRRPPGTVTPYTCKKCGVIGDEERKLGIHTHAKKECLGCKKEVGDWSHPPGSVTFYTCVRCVIVGREDRIKLREQKRKHKLSTRNCLECGRPQDDYIDQKYWDKSNYVCSVCRIAG